MSNDFLNAPVYPEIVATKEKPTEKRTGTALAVIYADSVAFRLLTQMAAESHVNRSVMSDRPSTLQDEFAVSGLRNDVPLTGANPGIAVVKKGPKQGL